MTKPITAALAMALACTAASAPDEKPAFEVASVKLSAGGPILGCRGGPGTADPGRYSCAGSLFTVLTFAFKARTWELSGPEWLKDVRIDVNAKLPVGATREQLSAMLQNLLADRFKMAFHREQREMPVYDLMFVKMGPNLTEVADAPAPAPAAAPGQAAALDRDGFPIIPGGSGMRVVNGRGRIQFRWRTMYNFAYFLAGQLGERPVLDATGLGDKHYALTLSWYTDLPNGGAPDAASGSNIFKALQDQLGLKLAPKKETVEITVIDHMERTPAEN